MNRHFQLLAATAVVLILSDRQLPGQTSAVNRPAFEVATIKPNDPVKNPNITSGWSTSRSGLRVIGTLHTFIKQAYQVEDTQISGGPNWIDRDVFEINAKTSSPAAPEELWLMFQTLLAERFQLAIHRETRQLPVYSLVVSKSGSKLRRVDGTERSNTSGPTLLRGSMNTAELAHSLTAALRRTVIDETGLNGIWKFSLTWAPDDQTSGPSVFTAIQEQLGLKLVSAKGPVEVLVIDHAEKPSEN